MGKKSMGLLFTHRLTSSHLFIRWKSVMASSKAISNASQPNRKFGRKGWVISTSHQHHRNQRSGFLKLQHFYFFKIKVLVSNSQNSFHRTNSLPPSTQQKRHDHWGKDVAKLNVVLSTLVQDLTNHDQRNVFAIPVRSFIKEDTLCELLPQLLGGNKRLLAAFTQKNKTKVWRLGDEGEAVWE